MCPFGRGLLSRIVIPPVWYPFGWNSRAGLGLGCPRFLELGGYGLGDSGSVVGGGGEVGEGEGAETVGSLLVGSSS